MSSYFPRCDQTVRKKMIHKDTKNSVAIASTLLFAVLVFIIPTKQLGAQQQGVQLSAAVGFDSPTRLTELETSIGRNVDAVRHYRLWDHNFPSAHEIDLLNCRDMILSIKPIRNNRSPILWANIAAARPGDPLYQDMVRWANAIRPYQSQIWLSFHHEAEAGKNIPHGNANNFIAAWRNFMTVLNREGIRLAGRVWIATHSFELPASDRRHPDRWYPGDSWVEAIAADAFNWHECRTGINSAWMSPRSIFEPIRDFGRRHPNKQMMIGEFGSVEDPNNRNRKAQWITDFRNLFKEPSYSQFTHVSYFNLHQDEDIFDCDWRISTSTAATNAFAALANDPYYEGTGIATPFVAPATGTCTAVRSGNTVTLNWNSDGSVIRRNGDWLSTEPNGTTTFADANAPANATYIIRDFSNGRALDTSCEFRANAPQSGACTAVRTATSTVTLNWNSDGSIIRRNGGWLSTERDGTTTFTDTNAPANATYLIRDFQAGRPVDSLCEFDPNAPVNPCVVTFNANRANFVFGVPGAINLRKNGDWLATTTGTYIDSGGTVADSYVARTRNAGRVIDYACSRG